MKFGLYIKSHSTMPDYEDECEANSKGEAIHIFLSRGLRATGWDEEMLEDNVETDYSRTMAKEERRWK